MEVFLIMYLYTCINSSYAPWGGRELTLNTEYSRVLVFIFVHIRLSKVFFGLVSPILQHIVQGTNANVAYSEMEGNERSEDKVKEVEIVHVYKCQVKAWQEVTWLNRGFFLHCVLYLLFLNKTFSVMSAD